MEKLYVFGTGNALVTRCYNTCFALRDEESRIVAMSFCEPRS